MKQISCAAMSWHSLSTSLGEISHCLLSHVIKGRTGGSALGFYDLNRKGKCQIFLLGLEKDFRAKC